MDYKLIAAVGLVVIAGAFLLIWAIVQVRDRIGNPVVKDALTQLLYLLDEQCDNMEIPAKRAQAVLAIQQLLGCRRLFAVAERTKRIWCLRWRRWGKADSERQHGRQRRAWICPD